MSACTLLVQAFNSDYLHRKSYTTSEPRSFWGLPARVRASARFDDASTLLKLLAHVIIDFAIDEGFTSHCDLQT